MNDIILNQKTFEKRQKIYNQLCLGEKVDIKDFANWLRSNLTKAKKDMKVILNNIGVRFYTQYIIDPFIVDFCYRKYLLVIEIDGPHHNKEYDKKRDAFLKSQGYYVLRFNLRDLYYNPVFVENTVKKCLDKLIVKYNKKNLY